jgi:hypothetical protein
MHVSQYSLLIIYRKMQFHEQMFIITWCELLARFIMNVEQLRWQLGNFDYLV